MIWQSTPYLPALLVTAMACAILGAYVWRHRPTPGVGPAVASFVFTACWNVGYALELSSANYEAQLFWANIEYIFISAMPALMIVFAFIYTGRAEVLTRRVAMLLCVEPAVVILLAFASESIPLLRTGGQQITVDGSVVVAWAYGPLFWVHTLYSYGLMACATFILVPVILRSPHLYRLQAVVVVVGIFAPWLANAAYLFELSPYQHLDLTPFSFFFYAFAVGWAMLRLQFLDVVPVARDNVIEGLQDAVLVIGINGRIADANLAAQALLSSPEGRLVGCRPDELTAELAQMLAPQRPVPAHFEVELSRDGGKLKLFDVRLTAVRDYRGGLRGRVAVFTDQTERRLAEEDRVRTQRLLAAGELAAGIAHNLNNILVGILAPARRLHEGETSELTRDASTIVSAAERARDLVQRLNQDGDSEAAIVLEAVDMAVVVEQAIETARPRWEADAIARGARIALSTDLGPVPLVRSDRTGLHDAVLNLVLNAADAMPKGGQLTIRAQRLDHQVAMEVTDSGVGMDTDTVARVFEPFFTTKVDIGTGLGLTTVHRSVQRWGGEVTVSSRLGQGTTFRLLLPVWDEATPVAATSEPRSKVVPGGARILIAEDEAIVAMVLADCARELGHEVEVVADGAQALQRLDLGGVDVAVLDLGIPELSGDEVARRAREQQVDLTTVLMTGWSLDPKDERCRAFDFLLQKPFDGHQARRVVNQAVTMSRQRSTREGG